MHTPQYQHADTLKPVKAWATPALLALRNAALTFAASLVMAGCSMLGPIDGPLSAVNKPLVKPTREPMPSRDGKPAVKSATPEAPTAEGPQFFKTPVTPDSTAAPVARKGPAAPSDAADGSLSAVTLDGIPLPQFINTVYATILKRNVSLDPAVQSRTDLVSLRTGKPQSPEQLSAAVQAVLKSYAVSINEFDGLVRAVPSAGVGGASPEIIRGRAQPDVPGSLRPVFYLVELDNTSQANVVGWVRTLFQGRVTITEDPPRNAILLSGQSDSVMAAVEAIQTLDKPGMRGRYSARMTPVFWSATDMATKLVDVLTAQGFSASINPSSPTPILVMPIAPINSVIVFAVSEESLNHALRWARDLDQTAPSRSGGRFITYYVRNTDALEVAKTLQEVMGGGAAAAPAVVGAAAAPRPAGSSKVVVNSAANSIIIQSSPAEYQQIYGLLQELDRPTRSALIMATVAEVSLTENEQFGFNWLLAQFSAGGYLVNGGMGPTPSGKVTSTDGIALNFASVAGDPRALLTALARSSRVRVLSNPSVVAISGQSAIIQVGQDVPILTSQISNSNTGTGTGQGILQTVQYRNVGIILKVKPVIRAGGRVDLEIGQEVSGASADAGVGGSPKFNTRRVDTRLSTVDGNTMLIGGLISEQRDGANAGIPYLKDIPILGGLFRSSASTSTTRTELVLLITPYVMEDDFDSRAITDAFRGQFSWSAGVPISTKATVEPNANTGDAGDAKSGAAKEVSPSYVVPPAPVEAPAPVAARPRMRDMGPPGESPKAAPDAAVSTGTTKAVPTPTKPGATTPSLGGSTPGKPVTDEALKQELMDAIRGVKR